MDFIWIVQGTEKHNIIACFEQQERAEAFIHAQQFKCILMQFPINISVYDWMIEKQYFKPKTDLEKSKRFKERFSSAYLAHDHFYQDTEEL